MEPWYIVALVSSHSCRGWASYFTCTFTLLLLCQIFLFFFLLLSLGSFLVFLLFLLFFFFEPDVVSNCFVFSLPHLFEFLLLPMIANCLSNAFFRNCNGVLNCAVEEFLSINSILHPIKQLIYLFTNYPELVDNFLGSKQWFRIRGLIYENIAGLFALGIWYFQKCLAVIDHLRVVQDSCNEEFLDPSPERSIRLGCWHHEQSDYRELLCNQWFSHFIHYLADQLCILLIFLGN